MKKFGKKIEKLGKKIGQEAKVTADKAKQVGLVAVGQVLIANTKHSIHDQRAISNAREVTTANSLDAFLNEVANNEEARARVALSINQLRELKDSISIIAEEIRLLPGQSFSTRVVIDACEGLLAAQQQTEVEFILLLQQTREAYLVAATQNQDIGYAVEVSAASFGDNIASNYVTASLAVEQEDNVMVEQQRTVLFSAQAQSGTQSVAAPSITAGAATDVQQQTVDSESSDVEVRASSTVPSI